MSSSDEPGSYEAHFDALSAVRTLQYFGLPVVVIAIGVWQWPAYRNALYIGAVCLVIIGFALFHRIRGIARRARLLVIDSRGIHLGRDDANRPELFVPWSAVDVMVYFRAQNRRGAGTHRTHYVGIVRHGHIVAYRHLAGSRFDPVLAADATVRFGRGVPFREAPEQESLSSETLPLPDEWLRWALRPDVYAIRPPDATERPSLFNVAVWAAVLSSMAGLLAGSAGVALPYIVAGVVITTAATILITIPIRQAAARKLGPDSSRAKSLRGY
ncbi:hypothetical protein [Actinoplanes sp. NPDC089786]|uniref:hypothetical protein n=1 Tax=Actinoplanes sp. NPDC089786 TaxID=3155185 RepID=UPI003442B1D3